MGAALAAVASVPKSIYRGVAYTGEKAKVAFLLNDINSELGRPSLLTPERKAELEEAKKLAEAMLHEGEEAIKATATSAIDKLKGMTIRKNDPAKAISDLNQRNQPKVPEPFTAAEKN